MNSCTLKEKLNIDDNKAEKRNCGCTSCQCGKSYGDRSLKWELSVLREQAQLKNNNTHTTMQFHTKGRTSINKQKINIRADVVLSEGSLSTLNI